MLAAYEQQKASNVPEPEAEKPQVHHEPPKRPILTPLPKVVADPALKRSAEDIWSWDVDDEADSDEDLEESAEIEETEELIAALEATPEQSCEPEPMPFPQERVIEASTSEAQPQAASKVSGNPRILMADPALRDTERVARREAAASNRVFLAPSAYRVGDDYVRSTRKSSHEEEDEEDYMSELPAAIRGHLVGSPLGRPNRVKSVKDEEAAPETAKKQKAPKKP